MTSTTYETVIQGEKKALELAVHGAPLREVLEVLVRTVEAHSTSGILCSILLLDDDGKHLREGAAPSLPAAYNAAIDGVEIGPTVGSCGTAAFTGKTVVVSDIANDPLWSAFKGLALEHGLRACWSTPILASDGAVLGTFAVYQRVVATPAARDLETVQLCSHTAAIVIEREINARRREASEAQLTAFMNHLPELAWTAKTNGDVDYLNQRWVELTGATFEQLRGSGWQNWLEPALVPEVQRRWRESLGSGKTFEMEHTLRDRDGVPRWFLTRVVPARGANGEITRWFGTSANIDTIRQSHALTTAVTEQSRETQRAILELRAAKERAERRVAELEGQRH